MSACNRSIKLKSVNFFQDETNKSEKIKVTLFNCLGKEIMRVTDEDATAGLFNKTIDISELPTGKYFCKLEISDSNFTKRVIVRK